jgi:SAM-dependent methyltransferase
MINWLKIKELETINLDSNETLEIHRKVIESKKLLIEIYRREYSEIFSKIKTISGPIFEIGAGAYNAKDFHYHSISTDLVQNKSIDIKIDAQNMPLENSSVGAFIMVNTLHHLPDPEKFFQESLRTLEVGGKIVMVEPYFSLWGHFLYKNFHHEPSIETSDWKIPNFKGGRLTDSNQMIPYLIFCRDREIFLQKFPEFEIESIDHHNFLAYALSGGLSYIQLIPNFLLPILWMVEKLAIYFPAQFACSMTICLKKKK